MRALRAPVGALVLVALAAGPARGNGRPPAVNSIAVDPRDPRRIVLGATFGPLLSTDCGSTWRWTCEQAVGYTGVWDPKFLFSRTSSAIFATAFDGLAVTRDEGCSWSFAPSLADFFVDDLAWATETTTAGTTEVLWAVTSSAARTNCVYQSRDDGATFEPSGLCSDTLFFKSIAVAPSDQQQVYVVSYNPNLNVMRPSFHKSSGRDAAGVMQFQTLELPQAFWTMTDLRLVGVDRTDANRIYVRGKDQGGPHLYTTADGGVNWMRITPPDVTQITAAILVEDHLLVATSRTLLRSSNRGQSFEPVGGTPFLSCLASVSTLGAPRETYLYGCANPFQEPRAAALISRDFTNFTPLFKFENLYGPLECGGDAPTTKLCTPLWPGLAMQLFTPGSRPVAGPSCGAGGGAPADGGAAGASPPADAAPVVTRDGGTVARSNGGCHASGAGAGLLGGLLPVLLGLSVGAVRRRASAARRRPPG